MQTFLTPLTVFIATLFGFAFSGLWYSPVLFLTTWFKVHGYTNETAPKRSIRYLIRINVYTFIAHGCMAAVLALMFDLLEVTTLSVAVSVGAILALGFVVTGRYIDMLFTLDGTHWERKSQIRFLLSAGSYLFSIIIMSAVIFISASSL